MFITTATVQSNLQDRLQRSTRTGTQVLEPFWTSIISEATTRAYWDIIQGLMSRGFSKTLIDQWDRGAEFQLSIALWHCYEWGSANDSTKIQGEALKEDVLDRRLELQNRIVRGVVIPGVILTIGGAWQDPDTTHSQPTTGPADIGSDLFALDPTDARIGQAESL